MRFKVLGPLEVRAGEHGAGASIDLKAGMQRRLLAVLLTSPGRVVPTTGLVEALWPDEQPENAFKTLQVYVYRLRRELGSDRVGNVPGGYRLNVEPSDVDGHRFVEMVHRAETARSEGDTGGARDLLEQALALWTGPPYVEFADEQAIQPEVRRLTECRLRALEDRAELALERGGHAGVLPELSGLVAAHPYRERLHGLLMLALYRCGRQADALEEFRRTRDLLRDDLGVEPGPDLQRLHEQVLRTDPALDIDMPDNDAVSPAQLPPTLASFTGRQNELERLLAATDDVDRAVVVVSVQGMAGIGKTALAVEAAHRLSERFPDGQIFVDLHGFTEGMEPVGQGPILERLLRAIGLPGGRIPYDGEDRAALWRTSLKDRRMLLVLDNAATDAQVRPLLPGVPGSLVLVTSRRRLSGLDDLRIVSLDPPPVADAVSLFVQAVGPERVAVGDRVLPEIADLCGRLPLAVRLAAARLRSRPNWTPGDLVQRLRGEQARLGELAVGERSVRSAFEVSYDHLAAEHQRVFRRLGLHPGTTVDAYASAALADIGLDKAEHVLEDLVDLHLLESPGHGRYALHDLLRAYASDKAQADEDEASQRSALLRLLDYYAQAATRAMAAYVPSERHRWPDPDPVRTPVPVFGDRETALTWLDAERTNLVEVARCSVENFDGRHAFVLALCMFRYLALGTYHADEEAIDELAMRSARVRTDPGDRGRACNRLAGAYAVTGRHAAAARYFRMAMESAAAAGDLHSKADALSNLAQLHRWRGEFSLSLKLISEAIELRRTIGDRRGSLRLLNGKGKTLLYAGDLEAAGPVLLEAEQLMRDVDNPYVAGDVQSGLAEFYIALGDHAQALVHAEHALGTFTELRTVWGMCVGHVVAGNALCGLGRTAEALDHLDKARHHSAGIGEDVVTVDVQLALGQALCAAGRADEALGALEQALETAARSGQKAEVAIAYEQLGLTYEQLGLTARAVDHLQRAEDAYRRLGMQAAARVHERLNRLED